MIIYFHAFAGAVRCLRAKPGIVISMSRFDYTIVQVVPRLDSGGAERTTLEIAGAIMRAGGRALVVSEGGRLAADIERGGGEVVIAPVASKNPFVIWRNGGFLARLIEARRVALIHARSRAPAWSALMAARRTGVPLVATYHGAYRAAGPLKRWYNSSMLRADRVIANSRFTAERILADGFQHPEKLRVIPRGADLEVFNPARVSAARIEKLTAQWGLAPRGADGPAQARDFRLLLPARLTAWKGHEIAVEACARIKNNFVKSGGASGKASGLTLVFCGGAQGRDAYEQALRALVNERGVRDMIHFVGECADMPAAYAWADAVLAPSTRPEAFGRTAIEAGAMERPVIAADHGGARETVIDGETGYLVAPGDARALAAAIDRLADAGAPAARRMGRNGRARATSVYSSAAMCDATLRVYSDLLHRGPSGRPEASSSDRASPDLASSDLGAADPALTDKG